MSTERAKLKTYVGFAVKSGKIVWGTDNIETFRKKMHVILCDESLGENSRTKLENFAQERSVPIITVRDLAEFTARAGVKAIAIRNAELSGAIIKTVNTEV